jgi:signal transduction histidine kinase
MTTEQSRIRFATDILRRLGEELNPSVDQGLVELAKNAYDADARHCTFTLNGTDAPGGEIKVVDDGDGMSANDVIDGWLIVGSSTKSARQTTRLGRIPAGSKGLGRLAALRLGRRVEMKTRPRVERTVEYGVDIDWDLFDNAQLVDDVPLTIRRRTGVEGWSGTELLLVDLRLPIGRIDVKRLARALVLLADPFGDDPAGFEPSLVAQEYRDLEQLVRNRYFGDSDYHLAAVLDESGQASASVLDHRGGVLWAGNHDDIAARDRHGRRYDCPPATFDLWVYNLSFESFQFRTVTIQEVREWLASFGGVHVYLNGLRVAPYGNTGDDWLEMNLRRVRSPEERPGTNTSIGRVALRDSSDRLVQKTDRGGFIESEPFLELKAFAQDAMEFMARRRLEFAEKKRQTERAEASRHTRQSRQNIEAAIESTKGPQRANLQTAFERYERSRDREVTSLRKEVQLYRTLSTAGITTATFAHESSGGPIKVILQAAGAIERRGRAELNDRYEATLAKPVALVRRAAAALGVLTTATLRLLDHDKRRPGRVHVHDALMGVVETFQPFLSGRNVHVSFELSEGTPYLRGSQAAIESIVTNLLNNSVAAFERGGTHERRITFRTRPISDGLELRVLDSGPGIDGISLSDIWLPGETTQGNGTGLGLTIVRDTVIDLGGRVNALAKGELGGAEIVLTLPLLGWDK